MTQRGTNRGDSNADQSHRGPTQTNRGGTNRGGYNNTPSRGRGNNTQQRPPQSPATHAVEFPIREDCVGKLIGPRGSNIAALRKEFGVDISVKTVGEHTVCIEGPQVSAEACRDRVVAMLSALEHGAHKWDPNVSSFRPVSGRYAHTGEFFIPPDSIGKLIGPKGSTIAVLRAQFNVAITIRDSKVTVEGVRHDVEGCQEHITLLLRGPCRNGVDCWNALCTYVHPLGWRSFAQTIKVVTESFEKKMSGLGAGMVSALDSRSGFAAFDTGKVHAAVRNVLLTTPSRPLSTTAQCVFCIDQPATKIFDDAFEIQEIGDGNVQLKVHICNVASVLSDPTLSDLVARCRHVMINTHAQTEAVKVLPQDCGAAMTLSRSEPRPVVTMTAVYRRVSGGGFEAVGSPVFSADSVQVNYMVTYDMVDMNTLSPVITAHITTALDLARWAYSVRGTTTNQSDVVEQTAKYSTKGGYIDVRYKRDNTPSVVLVNGLLGLYNDAALALLRQDGNNGLHRHVVAQRMVTPYTEEETARLRDAVATLFPPGVPAEEEDINLYLERSTRGAVSANDVVRAVGIRRVTPYEHCALSEAEKDAIVSFTHPLRSYICAHHQRLLLHAVAGGSGGGGDFTDEDTSSLVRRAQQVAELRQRLGDDEYDALFDAVRAVSVATSWGFVTAVRGDTVDVYLPNMLSERATVPGLIDARHVTNVKCEGKSYRLGQMTYLCFRKNSVSLGVPSVGEIPEAVRAAMTEYF